MGKAIGWGCLRFHHRLLYGLEQSLVGGVRSQAVASAEQILIGLDPFYRSSMAQTKKNCIRKAIPA